MLMAQKGPSASRGIPSRSFTAAWLASSVLAHSIMDPGFRTPQKALRRWKQASMTMMRKHYTPAFKAHIVQEALAGERTLAQIAAQHGLHPHLITKWKHAALQAMP